MKVERPQFPPRIGDRLESIIRDLKSLDNFLTRKAEGDESFLSAFGLYKRTNDLRDTIFELELTIKYFDMFYSLDEKKWNAYNDAYMQGKVEGLI